jgi:hypothetical protein
VRFLGVTAIYCKPVNLGRQDPLVSIMMPTSIALSPSLNLLRKGSLNAELNLDLPQRASRVLWGPNMAPRMALIRADTGSASATCAYAISPAHHACRVSTHSRVSSFVASCARADHSGILTPICVRSFIRIQTHAYSHAHMLLRSDVCSLRLCAVIVQSLPKSIRSNVHSSKCSFALTFLFFTV